VPSSRPVTRFLDILDNIRLIQSYLEGMDRAAFEADSRTRDAVERCLERLSEAATKLGSQVDELAPGRQWLSADRGAGEGASGVAWGCSQRRRNTRPSVIAAASSQRASARTGQSSVRP
jgi:hypothetical protein